MTIRKQVFEVIEEERDYQENVWPRGTGCERSVGEEILCMEECILVARQAWQKGDDYKPDDKRAMLNQIRKVVAIGVRCMENHGAPSGKR
jgi:hypothetical protein